MPQPCRIQMPCRSKARISASGTAAPPTSERMPRGSFQRPWLRESATAPRRRPGSGSSRWSARPATSVGGSCCIRSSRSSGCRCGPGKDQLDAHHHGAVRHAPAVGVEHRRHRQDHVGAAQAPEVAQAGDQRVQDGGAVRIHDALGPPGRARRVAHGHRVVLVVRRVLESRPGRRRPAALRSRRSSAGHRRAGERKHDHLLEPVQVGELPVQRQQHVVDRRGSGPARRPRSSRSRRARGAGSACASRRRRPECRSSTPGARGGSSTAWRRGRPSSAPAPAGPRPARGCGGSTRRSCAAAASCRAAGRRSRCRRTACRRARAGG